MKPMSVIILPLAVGTVVSSGLAAFACLGLYALVRPAAPPSPSVILALSVLLTLLVVTVLAKALQFAAKYHRLSRWAENERSAKAAAAEAARQQAEAEEMECYEERARGAFMQEAILRLYHGPELAAAAMFGNLSREYFERDMTTRLAYRKLQMSLAFFNPAPQAGGHSGTPQSVVPFPAGHPAGNPSSSVGAA